MNFDDIIDGMEIARSRGYQPTQVHLGADEVGDLLSDANFVRGGTPAANTSGSLGKVAGLDVQSAPTGHMCIMTAQSEEHVEFYIL